MFADNKLIIGHLNCRSLHDKVLDLVDFIASRKLSFLCLNKTWLRESDSNPFSDFSDRIQFFSTPRPLMLRGGGTAIIAPRSVVCHNHRFQCAPCDNEHTVISFVISGLRFVLASVYSPRGCTCPDLLSQISDLPSDHLIVAGDFNAKHVQWHSTHTNKKGKALSNTIHALDLITIGYTQHSFFTTRKHSVTSNIIDLFISSASLLTLSPSVVVCNDLGSYHLPIVLQLDLSSPSVAMKRVTLFSKADTESLNEAALVDFREVTADLGDSLLGPKVVDKLVSETSRIIR